MSSAEKYMLRCIELAKIGLPNAIPNPSVGCVIVHDNRIIGEGYTSPFGGNHAEVNAINSVEDESLLPESTLYASLEPCAHYGKTPPCANLIIEKKIKRVVIATLDPFSEVNGLGIKRLIEKGVDVKVGMLEKEARESNKRFFTFHEKKQPYIILKWAETSNGFVDSVRASSATESLKITSKPANVLVHKWRAEEQAIMVGKNTVLLDNPSLTTRNFEGKNPVKILLDSNCSSPADSNVLNTQSKTIVLNSVKNETDGNTEFVKLDNLTDVNQVQDKLYELGIQSILIEGGPTLHKSFYESDNWDEIRRFVSPISTPEGVSALSVEIEPNFTEQVGKDKLYTYRNL